MPASYAAWVERVDSYVPLADFMLFVGQEPADGSEPWMFTVPWERALALAGALLERRSEMRPARYRTQGWFDEGALSALWEARDPAGRTGGRPPFVGKER